MLTLRLLSGFPGGSVVKNPPANAGDVGDLGLIPGWGRFPGGGHGNPLQYSCLENPMDRGAWRAVVHRVTQSRARLSDLARRHRLPPAGYTEVARRIWVARGWDGSQGEFLGAMLHSLGCRILVPQPGIEPTPPTVKARNPNYWTPREFPQGAFLTNSLL